MNAATPYPLQKEGFARLLPCMASGLLTLQPALYARSVTPILRRPSRGGSALPEALQLLALTPARKGAPSRVTQLRFFGCPRLCIAA
jgi:hypothetical protein